MDEVEDDLLLVWPGEAEPLSSTLDGPCEEVDDDKDVADDPDAFDAMGEEPSRARRNRFSKVFPSNGTSDGSRRKDRDRGRPHDPRLTIPRPTTTKRRSTVFKGRQRIRVMLPGASKGL